MTSHSTFGTPDIAPRIAAVGLCNFIFATLLLAGGSTGCVASGSGTDFGPGGGVSGADGSTGGAGAGASGTGISTGVGGSTPRINVDPEASAGDPDARAPGVYMLPTGFTAGTSGGYKLGPPFTSMQPAEMDAGVDIGGCGGAIVGITRDFKIAKQGGHPDFETVTLDKIEPGIVEAQLDANLKPVYAGPATGTHNGMTHGKTNFDQWYRNVNAVNQAFLVYLVVQPNGGIFTFDSTMYFPLDDQGWGNETKNHNFGFTSEFHTSFQYNGGETFSFRGDDDVWVFIDHKLAIDLGGLHQAQMQAVMLDTLGLTKGKVYAFDLFHAERHSSESNFRIDTNLAFVNCGVIVNVN